jgi:hypothetical protein
VDDKNSYGSNDSNGAQTVAVRVRIRFCKRKRVIKHVRGGFQVETVISLVRPVLFGSQVQIKRCSM